jgi:hypothetical protein
VGLSSSGFGGSGDSGAGHSGAGYHSAGYHLGGYHSAGYHSAGYHSAGYNSAGYNGAGYHSGGYKSGYNSAGFDSGYNSAGESSALDDAPPLPKRQAATPALSFGPDSDDTSGFGAITAGHQGVPDLDGLPVRVRQASLAPQLREPTAPQQFVPAPQMPGESPAEQARPGDPSPDAARSFMSALQRGWERGRSMADQLTDEPDAEQS